MITSVKGCEFSSGNARGIQVTYGIWENGVVTNEIPLNEFGQVSGSCTTLSVEEGDRIKTVSIIYTNSEVD